MDPVIVNGFVALTGVAAGVACAYVPTGDVRLAMGGYAVFVLGYVIQRFGSVNARPVKALSRGMQGKSNSRVDAP